MLAPSEFQGPAWLAFWHEMRTMGLKQNLYRIWYEASRRVGLHRKRFRAGPISDDELRRELAVPLADGAALVEHLRRRDTVRFFFDWRDRVRTSSILNDRFSSERARCVELADEVCRHRFELLGTVTDFEGQIDWHRLLGTDQSWPRQHWSTISIRNPVAIGEIKTTWELNRQQFWLHLGRAYWYTGDEKYAREWATELRSWLDQNTPEIGVNWASNLEVALRAVSWTWSLEFFLDSPALAPDLAWDMMKTLLHMARHLVKDVPHSIHVQPSNHLLGDAMGLVFIGVCFPEFREARRWRDYGLRLLWDWLPRLARPDGTVWEQATSYQRFVLYFFILVDRLARLNGVEPPPMVRERMERMIDFEAALLKPDRTMTVLGDCDDARTIFLSNDAPQDYLPTLSTGAVLFGRGDWKLLAERLSEETFWLLGADALDAWDRLEPREPPAGQTAFAGSGTFVSRDGWARDGNFVLVHCGPFTGHRMGHLGHLELSVQGQNVLGGTGTYTYNGPWEWRTYFRQSSAHNTVTVDGHGQALSHRSFRFLFEPRDIRGGIEPSGDAERIDVSHRSFRFLGGIRHRRIVHFRHGGFYLVIDLLTGKGEHYFSQHWHFECGPIDVDDRGRATLALASGRRFVVVPLARPDLSWSLVEGSTDPIQGWRSRRFGRREPAPCLTYQWRDACPSVMATLLAVASTGDEPALAADAPTGGKAQQAFRVTVAGDEHRVVVP